MSVPVAPLEPGWHRQDTEGVPATDGTTGGGSVTRLRRDARANQERVLAAAVSAVLREGRQVPMSKIAEEAGVGVGTLYRRYPTREALLAALSERSFAMVQALAEKAAGRPGPAIVALDEFLDGTIEHRDQLVLPLHGGPSTLTSEARSGRRGVHDALGRLLERGRGDGTVRADVTPLDVVVFGAMLAQPLSEAPGWLAAARRQKVIFLAGLAPLPPSLPGPR